MTARRVLTIPVAALAITVGLAACGAGENRTPRPRERGESRVVAARRRTGRGASRASHRANVVYEWGQFGGGRPPQVTRRAARGLAVSGSPYGIGPVRRAPHVVRGIHGAVVQVAASNSDDYALTREGAVYAWGPGRQGELGDGRRTRLRERAVRVAFPRGVRIRALANPMPYNAGMAIAADGRVWGWGNDRARELCQRQGAILTRPVPVPLSDVSLAAGALRHAVYDSHGHILSCGAGPKGQLGDGASGPEVDTGRPVAVRDLPSGRAVALTSGWGNAGVLMADGRYYDWGYNADGQVGDGHTHLARTAQAVPLPGRVRAVFEGGSYANNGQSEAILRDGALWEWGDGGADQLGVPHLHRAITPVPLHLPDHARAVSVNSGGSTDYAIAGRHRLWAWGDNRAGQLGDAQHSAAAPRPVLDPVKVSEIASTAHNVVALGAPRFPN